MKKTKVGIIGTGFSALAHLEAIRRIPSLEVVAIGASSKDKAEQIAKEYGISRAYGDAFSLIHDSQVEAIHNCTPNFLHDSINREALLAGKHILSEKPLGMNSEQTREIAELAGNSSCVNGVAFNYRHYPLIAETKHRITNGSYGKVHLVYGGFLQDWMLYNTDYNWRLNPEQNGALRAIADIGSHWCDTVQHVLGKNIVEVFADLKTVHPIRMKPKAKTSAFEANEEAEYEEIPVNTEDYGSVLVHFEDGIHGVFTISQVSAGRKNKLFFEIAAEKGTLAWNQEEPNLLWIGQRDEENKELVRDPNLLSGKAAAVTHYPGGHQEGWPDALKNLMIDFYSCVTHENNEKGLASSSSFATFQDGYQMMLLMEAILESHHTKKWVVVPNH